MRVQEVGRWGIRSDRENVAENDWWGKMGSQDVSEHLEGVDVLVSLEQTDEAENPDGGNEVGALVDKGQGRDPVGGDGKDVDDGEEVEAVHQPGLPRAAVLVVVAGVLHAHPHAEAVLDGEDQHRHELARLEERLVLVAEAEALAPHALRVGVGLHGADHEQQGLGEDEVQDEVLEGAVEVALQRGNADM